MRDKQVVCNILTQVHKYGSTRRHITLSSFLGNNNQFAPAIVDGLEHLTHWREDFVIVSCHWVNTRITLSFFPSSSCHINSGGSDTSLRMFVCTFCCHFKHKIDRNTFIISSFLFSLTNKYVSSLNVLSYLYTMYQFPIMGCKALEETGVEFNSIDTERRMDGIRYTGRRGEVIVLQQVFNRDTKGRLRTNRLESIRLIWACEIRLGVRYSTMGLIDWSIDWLKGGIRDEHSLRITIYGTSSSDKKGGKYDGCN